MDECIYLFGMLISAVATPPLVSCIMLASVPVPLGAAEIWMGIFFFFAVSTISSKSFGFMFAPLETTGPPPILTSPRSLLFTSGWSLAKVRSTAIPISGFIW